MTSITVNLNGDVAKNGVDTSNPEKLHSESGNNVNESRKPIANLPPVDQLAALIESGLTEAEALESWKQLHSAPALSAPFVQRADTPAGGQELYPWVQLSGHRENFRPGLRPGTVLKVLCQCEADCLKLLAADAQLSEFVPRYFGTVRLDDGTDCLEMQDLLADFPGCTGLMDCKMGSRTYLESELEGDPKPRRDLYDKMVEVDPSAPTTEELEACGVAKPRYMMWREQLSSTATLAFRIDGLQQLAADRPPHVDLKRLRNRPEVADTLAGFVEGRGDLRDAYLTRLRRLRQALAKSEIFAQREFIGSSLLFVHDQTPGHASVWMIDFGKTRLAPGGPLSHTDEWLQGNHEDGYLTGLDNLIGMFAHMTVKSIAS